MSTRRGRPPDLEARRRTLDLAGLVLREAGYAGLTMDLLAYRAGVSKKSLYRWWPNKAAVAAEALASQAEVRPVPESGDSRTELLALARNARHYATTDKLPLGVTAQLPVADQQAFGRSYLEHVIRPRRLLSRDVVARAIARGDLPRDTDIDALLDLWSGFAVYRQSVRGAEVTDHLLEQLVDMALAGSVARNPDIRLPGVRREDAGGRGKRADRGAKHLRLRRHERHGRPPRRRAADLEQHREGPAA